MMEDGGSVIPFSVHIALSYPTAPHCGFAALTADLGVVKTCCMRVCAFDLGRSQTGHQVKQKATEAKAKSEIHVFLFAHY